MCILFHFKIFSMKKNPFTLRIRFTKFKMNINNNFDVSIFYFYTSHTYQNCLFCYSIEKAPKTSIFVWRDLNAVFICFLFTLKFFLFLETAYNGIQMVSFAILVNKLRERLTADLNKRKWKFLEGKTLDWCRFSAEYLPHCLYFTSRFSTLCERGENLILKKMIAISYKGETVEKNVQVTFECKWFQVKEAVAVLLEYVKVFSSHLKCKERCDRKHPLLAYKNGNGLFSFKNNSSPTKILVRRIFCDTYNDTEILLTRIFIFTG